MLEDRFIFKKEGMYMSFDKNELRELKISGSGSSSGGKFDEVSISGSGKIYGDTECNNFRISGSGKVIGNLNASEFKISGSGGVEGNLKCKSGKISGSGKVLGHVDSEDFNISGSGKIEGDLSGKEITISGSAKVLGSIYGTDVKISGGIDIEKNVETDNFQMTGSFKSKGMLNAENVNIYLGGISNVEEIGATNIEILKRPSRNNIVALIAKVIGNNFGTLTTKVIEADEIYLENTKAEVVRGKNVIIGDGCNIKLVEYKNELKILGNGIVGEERHI
ncbi:cell shape determination protein CcmA [Clostridium argentinense]|nr:cell shape determination protein CcmA [Clostridium argentinense]NFP72057.1 cell shape determination protein CcmA [Clostridium argentinense]NFP76758.1 cell shape determination protein CcmA [Clostridium argentinense]